LFNSFCIGLIYLSRAILYVHTFSQQLKFSAKHLNLFLFLLLIFHSAPLYLFHTPLFRKFKDEEDNFYLIGSITLKMWNSTSAMVGKPEEMKSLGRPILSWR